MLENAYRLTRLIGEGGMGAVYEAVHLRLNKRVAIKLLASELSTNSEALARFHREAQITSHLGHPHLVNVSDFGVAATGEPYIVMEYLNGEDLEHRIAREGKLPINVVLHIVKQAASALNAAHAQGVVHRDLKPANLFLMQVQGEPDFVKILDFGVSKMKAARTKLTRASAVIGTPNYMSPEQAMGLVDEIDHRADQWALACIGWEMLSGRPPFNAEDMNALFYQITNLEPQPLAKRVPGLPEEVEQVLRRALSKKSTDRYDNIREFNREMEVAVMGFASDPTPSPVSPASLALIHQDSEPLRLGEVVAAESAKVESFMGPTDTPPFGDAAASGVFSWGSGKYPGKSLFKQTIKIPIAGIVLLGIVIAIWFERSAEPIPAAKMDKVPTRSPVTTVVPIAPLPPPTPPIPDEGLVTGAPPVPTAKAIKPKRQDNPSVKTNPSKAKGWVDPFMNTEVDLPSRSKVYPPK